MFISILNEVEDLIKSCKLPAYIENDLLNKLKKIDKKEESRIKKSLYGDKSGDNQAV